MATPDSAPALKLLRAVVAAALLALAAPALPAQAGVVTLSGTARQSTNGYVQGQSYSLSVTFGQSLWDAQPAFFSPGPDPYVYVPYFTNLRDAHEISIGGSALGDVAARGHPLSYYELGGEYSSTTSVWYFDFIYSTDGTAVPLSYADELEEVYFWGTPRNGTRIAWEAYDATWLPPVTPITFGDLVTNFPGSDYQFRVVHYSEGQQTTTSFDLAAPLVVSAVPEPHTYALAVALAAFLMVAWRRGRRRQRTRPDRLQWCTGRDPIP